MRERIAAVFSGGRQGSGYLLSPRVVLTAAHVISNPQDIRVAVLGGPGDVWCQRVWRPLDHDIDIMLIEAPADLIPPTAPIRLGSVVSLAPIRECQAIGFPSVQRGGTAGMSLDSEQLIGTLKPGSGMTSHRYVLDSDHAPPSPREDGGSAWAGMSGAAVFSDDALAAVVTGDPRGWPHSRLSTVPVQVLLQRTKFLEALRGMGCAHEVVRIGQPGDPDAEFELRHARYIAERHSRLTIFGIDLSSRSRASWPLDAAYVSLEATGQEQRIHEDGVPAPSGPRPADQALAGHDRVLLRGVAGSGKTTLVQWLTVKAVADGSSGRIPFVLPLRTLVRRDALPMPAEFLSAVRAPITPPQGWAERVLTAGRGLLLVDGLDEIGEREREQVRNWLRDLLMAFPGNQWMVTTRPSAVEDAWLGREGFTDLTLAPMNRADVTAFVERWHEAARATETDEDELGRLDAYQGSLHEAIRTKQDLARLATNPLMCGLICALHRDRHGYLPHGRKELYEAALSMLLARRDRERDLPVQLTEEPQIQLLQKLAYWMIRNGQAEMDPSDAVDLIDAALPSMPDVAAALGDARQVFRHLLERSGLLREPAEGTVDFVHRTFQDYLGAKAAVEERDFDLMVRNAHHDQWSDVIRMATAHARPAERARLLRKLIARGDRTKSHRARLHLLAMACLEHAPELDPAVRAEVNDRTAALIPPRTDEEAAALAAIGPVVLELLPGPDGLEDDEAVAVVRTAIAIGTDAAIPLLARFRDHRDSVVRTLLARNWIAFDDSDRYATEILSHLSRNETLHYAYTTDDLRTLGRMGGVERLLASGPVMADDLISALERNIVRYLAVCQNPGLSDLRFLSSFSQLNGLQINECPSVRDLSSLGHLPLSELSLFDLPHLDLAGLETSTRIESLSIGNSVPWEGIASLPRTLPLKNLYITGTDPRLAGIEEFPALRHLGLSGVGFIPSPEDWEYMSAHPGLNSISLFFDEQSRGLPRHLEMAGIDSLGVNGPHVAGHLADIARCFPALRNLVVHGTPANSGTVDLAPLAELPHLTAVYVNNAAAILNADRLPGAEITARPRPRNWGTARA